ncbi:TIGR02281 family clan AA aspartic protease [uncultured Cohaesibacter sp.]|uniref:TIGR02281 family clan AA aspartic protease n=1 Tax=uncultured Cohaesibacter sp. TaxID=1002546 RepID=UPI00292DA309|nr:TIGR02281 family clan AA aspartic protease [uncultured Cohaesibacter sp.]
MMVDSGASSVVLTHEDALTIGIDTANLNYASPVNTANGKAYTARIWLNKISVGGIEAKTRASNGRAGTGPSARAFWA